MNPSRSAVAWPVAAHFSSWRFRWWWGMAVLLAAGLGLWRYADWRSRRWAW